MSIEASAIPFEVEGVASKSNRCFFVVFVFFLRGADVGSFLFLFSDFSGNSRLSSCVRGSTPGWPNPWRCEAAVRRNNKCGGIAHSLVAPEPDFGFLCSPYCVLRPLYFELTAVNEINKWIKTAHNEYCVQSMVMFETEIVNLLGTSHPQALAILLIANVFAVLSTNSLHCLSHKHGWVATASQTFTRKLKISELDMIARKLELKWFLETALVLEGERILPTNTFIFASIKRVKVATWAISSSPYEIMSFMVTSILPCQPPRHRPTEYIKYSCLLRKVCRE